MTSCTIVINLCILTICGFIKNVQSESTNVIKFQELVDDLPERKDLDEYLSSLEEIANFASDHKYYVDIHVAFGFLLVNVHLKHIFNTVGKELPQSLQVRFDQLFDKSDDILSYYQEMVDSLEKISPEETPEVFISGLFYKNEKNWEKHLKPYHPDLLKMTNFYTMSELEDIYSDWVDYVDKVFNLENVSPTPEQAITCLAELDRDGHLGNDDEEGGYCTRMNSCFQMILNGTEYGYPYAHRLLYIIMGRFGRGCSQITKSLDSHVIGIICRNMYNEAEYIAEHDSKIPYLAMGQMALCSLEGHLQLLRRSWIEPLLEYQTEYGCFGRTKPRGQERLAGPEHSQGEPEWQIHRRGPIMGEKCNTPTTGVATSMLAAAIRLVLERYYKYA